MSVLDISVDSEGDVPVLVLRGELDLSGAAGLEDRLVQAEASDPPVLIVDLRQLDFIDSSGLRLLLEADQRARAGGRRFVVVRGPQAVQRVLEVTTLADRLDIVEDPGRLDEDPAPA